MMMTQSYYGGDYDAFARSNHRAPTAAHYDRPVPYTHGGYYEQMQQDLRSEYVGRQGTHAMIHEQGPDNGPPGHARRRIQVACSRCRRRKIKCTGDPGDGSGCSACRSAGADRNTCTFMRVGAQQVPIPGVDIMPASSGVQSSVQTTATYGTDATSNNSYDGSLYQNHHRPSLPMLQTRTAYPDYETYNTSPVDDYTYASSAIPRQQSLSSTYGAENFRPWTSGSISTPSTSTSMYYEPGAAFSFGTLQAAGPFPATPINRLPSVTGDAFSPLNMASLHSSLPTQTVQERRLPVPYAQSYQQPNYASAEVPQIRPLGSFSETHPRAHIHGIHSRNGMPWSNETASGRSMSRGGSIGGLPMPSSQQQHYAAVPLASSGTSNTPLNGEPILGYQFSTTVASPEISPTSGPAMSESFSSVSSSSTAPSSMLPPSTSMRYSTSNGHHNDDQSRPPSAHDASASLYSYSSGMESAERSTANDRHSSRDDGQMTATPQNYPPMRHPQPQHAASLDGLRRRSSHEQRPTTTHRMSVSNLNGRY